MMTRDEARAAFVKARIRAAKYHPFFARKGTFTANVKAELVREGCVNPTPADWARAAEELAEDVYEGYCDGEASYRMEGDPRAE